MTGIVADDITSFKVTAGTTTRHRALTDLALTATTDSINLAYTVSAEFPGASYSALSTELSTSVANGTFDKYLNTYSTKNGVTDLIGCTSSSVETVQMSTSSSTDDEISGFFSLPVIIGVAVGGAVLLCCIVAFTLWYCRRNKSSDRESLSSRTRRSSSDSRRSKFTEFRSYNQLSPDVDEESVSFGMAHHMSI